MEKFTTNIEKDNQENNIFLSISGYNCKHCFSVAGGKMQKIIVFLLFCTVALTWGTTWLSM
ncbi:TPA: hypothetical protein ACHWY1_004882, partial [Escherichia coli]